MILEFWVMPDIETTTGGLTCWMDLKLCLMDLKLCLMDLKRCPHLGLLMFFEIWQETSFRQKCNIAGVCRPLAHNFLSSNEQPKLVQYHRPEKTPPVGYEAVFFQLGRIPEGNPEYPQLCRQNTKMLRFPNASDFSLNLALTYSEPWNEALAKAPPSIVMRLGGETVLSI